ncbi:MAG: hypothetical protein FJZ56_04630 [Chlamydiae bacterium]|nr:hypothetical protein [Chlamydiota bacterium]
MKHNLIATHVRLSRLDPVKKLRLTNYLPKEEAHLVALMPKFDKNVQIGFSSKDDLINSIHPSWLTGIKQMQSSLAKNYIQDSALASLDIALPIQFASKTPLDFLFQISSEMLLKMCRFLGLYDVSLEMKKIIHSHQIKKIEEAFTKDEILFLQQCKKEKNLVSFIEIGLWNWDGDKKLLEEIILVRGMNRMAKALSEACDTFMWYLCHKMPKNEGMKLMQFHKPLQDKKIIESLIQQVESTYVYIKDAEG